jgi:hypothetical protein
MDGVAVAVHASSIEPARVSPGIALHLESNTSMRSLILMPPFVPSMAVRALTA